MQQLIEDTDEETVVRILANFARGLEESFSKTVQAVAVQDVDTIWKASHKVAGSAGLLGFVVLGGHARDLSTELKADLDFSKHKIASEEFLLKMQTLLAQLATSCPNLKSCL